MPGNLEIVPDSEVPTSTYLPVSPTNIVDEHGQLLNSEPEDKFAIVETIIPYFPDDEDKRKYLAYISSGFTRKEAKMRLYLKDKEVEEWRASDPDFAFLDDQGYKGLRDTVANAYLELLVRRGTLQTAEMGAKVLTTVEEKLDTGEELSPDEKFILNKFSSLFTVDSLERLNKLVNHSTSDEEGVTTFDFVAFVKGRVHR